MFNGCKYLRNGSKRLGKLKMKEKNIHWTNCKWITIENQSECKEGFLKHGEGDLFICKSKNST